jgi:hypothetical protein
MVLLRLFAAARFEFIQPLLDIIDIRRMGQGDALQALDAVCDLGQENLSLVVNLPYLLALHQFLYPSSIVILPLSILFDSQQPLLPAAAAKVCKLFFVGSIPKIGLSRCLPYSAAVSPGCVKARLVPEKP